MKWEYMSVMIGTSGFWLGGKLDGNAFNAELNKLGEQGWELVTVFDTNMSNGATRDVIAVLKRPSAG